MERKQAWNPGERVRFDPGNLAPLVERWIGDLECAMATDMYQDIWWRKERHKLRVLLHLEDEAMKHEAGCAYHRGYALDLVRASMADDYTDAGEAAAHALFPWPDNRFTSAGDETLVGAIFDALRSAAEVAPEGSQTGIAPYRALHAMARREEGGTHFCVPCQRWLQDAGDVCRICGSVVLGLEHVRNRAAESGGRLVMEVGAP